MKRFDVEAQGQVLIGLSAVEVAAMFDKGKLLPSSRCRETGSGVWGVVNERFPLLKYQGRSGIAGAESGEGVEEARALLPPRAAAGLLGLLMGILLTLGVQWMIQPRPSTTPLAQTVTRTRSDDWPQALPYRDLQPPPSVYSVQPQTTYLQPPLPIYSVQSQETYLQHAMPVYSVQQHAPVRPPATSTSANMITFSNGVMSSSSAVMTNSRQRVPSRPRPEAPVSRVPEQRVQPFTAPKATPAPEEYTIPLETWQTISSPYGSVRLMVRDHGPVTFTVWIGSDGPRRIEKEKGFERTGTNIVQIWRFPRAKVYYVDRVGVSLGHCVIRVIPDA